MRNHIENVVSYLQAVSKRIACKKSKKCSKIENFGTFIIFVFI